MCVKKPMGSIAGTQMMDLIWFGLQRKAEKAKKDQLVEPKGTAFFFQRLGSMQGLEFSFWIQQLSSKTSETCANHR